MFFYLLYNFLFYDFLRNFKVACSLVFSDLRSETKGSLSESSCELFAEVSSLQS